MLQIELVNWNEAREKASSIRFTVFVEEQRVPVEIEWDEQDAKSLHALAYAGSGEAIATGRLLPDGHVGRMAVLKAWRGRGVGGALLERLIAAARERGDTEIELFAQTHALEFYRRHGFVERGEIFEEAGIPHQAMRRAL
ncbi:MAG: GNAT family N-acetyltransferase [Burkholderiales bacterium]